MNKVFMKRLCMTLVGVFLCSIAVGFFKCSLFGVDPFQCFAWGVWGKFVNEKMAFGTYYMLISVAFLVVDLFLDKHYIGIATFINLFLTGYIVDFSQHTIASIVPEPTMAVRIGFIAFAVLVMCFASSLYMTSDLGVSVYDAIPIIISNKTKFQFRFCRVGCDLICVLIGFSCGLMPGIGTLITAFFMGPLIDFFNRVFSRPFLYGKEA